MLDARARGNTGNRRLTNQKDVLKIIGDSLDAVCLGVQTVGMRYGVLKAVFGVSYRV